MPNRNLWGAALSRALQNTPEDNSRYVRVLVADRGWTAEIDRLSRAAVLEVMHDASIQPAG